MIGSSISHYEVVEEIGRGGMGVVYKAEDTRLGRIVALKFLAEHLGRDEKARERFMQEARAAAALSHANIATLFDVGDVDGRLYLAMEYAEGHPLDELIADGSVTPSAALDIALQTARGLHRAHETGIVHRDIKPANIRISELGDVKILDFGLAKLSDSLFQSATGTIVGTAAYMSPEQIRGEPLTRRTDLWSLGVVLYEMLTGRRPFIGEYEHAMYYTILNVEPMPVSDLRPEIGDLFDPILDRLLDKDPDQRIGSCMELISRLEALRTRGIPDVEQTTTFRAREVEPAAWSGAVVASAGSEARRQITVVHSEIAGYAELSARMDPEDLLDLSETARNTWERIITQFEGTHGTFSGGTIHGFFGYPTAHENDPRRAVRCALALRQAGVESEGVNGPIRTQVRIGIDTGIAVVRSEGGDVHLHGNVENVADALAEHAEPGTIVVSRSTHQICGGYFNYEDLGERPVRGFNDAIPVYEVVGESQARTRLEFADGASLSPLVGREAELDMLRLSWKHARAGEGGAILLTGEAGIGKSRLTDSFIREIADGNNFWHASLYCSPFNSGTALFPAIDFLRRRLSVAPNDDGGSSFDELRLLLESAGISADRDLALMSSLLGIRLPAGFDQPDLAPAARKRATLELLLRLLTGRSASEPGILVLEDLHWADPTTKEWIDLVVRQVPAHPMLVVFTARPEYRPDWLMLPRTLKIELNRLDRDDLLAISMHRTGKRLPPEIQKQIAEKTDGVPLFAEELTNMILESGILEDRGDHYDLTGPLPEHVIPDTLQGSLVARLDRIDPQRYVAELGSVIGREFTFDLLFSVAGVERERLVTDLDVLLESELIFQRGFVPDSSYIFKHALIQDAAYNGMLRSRRKTLHEHVALVLEEREDTFAPELIAYHYRKAGLIEEAIPYLKTAGVRAMQRYENAEAVLHLGQALDLVSHLPEDGRRDLLEISLRVLHGHALNMSVGYHLPNGERSLLRAIDLAEAAGAIEPLVSALFGLASIYQIRGDYDNAVACAERSRAAVESSGEERFRVLSESSFASTYTFMGEIERAVEHSDTVIDIYDPEIHDTFRELGVGTLIRAAESWKPINLYLLGYPDQAASLRNRLLEEARGYDYHFDFYETFIWMALYDHARRDYASCRRIMAEYLYVGREYGDPYPVSICTVTHNLAVRGPDAEQEFLSAKGILDQLRATGYGCGYSLLLGQYAAGLIDYGRPDEAQAALNETFEHLRSLDTEMWQAEVHRLQGELILLRNGSPEEAAEEFEKSLEHARLKSCRMFELRTATSLARLRLSEGRPDDARALIEPLLDWFNEGFDTRDLEETQELMDQLRLK